MNITTLYKPNNEIIFSQNVDDDSSIEQRIGNYSTLTLSVTSKDRYDIPVGSYAVHNSVTYMLYEEKNCSLKKESDNKWLYDITLCDEFRLLTHVFARSMIEEISTSGYKTPTEFTRYGNVMEHVQMVVDSMNYRYSGWQIGFVKEVDYRDFIDYANVKCFDALGSIAEKFGVELTFEFGAGGKKIINMGKESSKVISLSYGAGGGILPGYTQDNSQTNPDIRRLIVLTGSEGVDSKNPLTEGWNQWKLTPGDIYEIGVNVYRVSEDGLSVTRDGANELGVEETVDLKEVKPEFYSNITSAKKREACSFKINSEFHETFNQQLYNFIYWKKDVEEKSVYVSFSDGKMKDLKSEFEYSKDGKFTISPFVYNGVVYPNDSVFPSDGDRFMIMASDNKYLEVDYGYVGDPKGWLVSCHWNLTEVKNIGDGYVVQDDSIGGEAGSIGEAIVKSLKIQKDPPSILFESGKLKGEAFYFEFEPAVVEEGLISTFWLKFKPDDNKKNIPNEIFYPQVGDKYMIDKMTMPDNLIKEMSGRLLKRAAEYYDERVGMNRSYDIEIDEIFVRDHIEVFRNLRVGDYCNITDGDYIYKLKILNINSVINNPNNYALRLGSTKKKRRRMTMVNPGLSDYRLNSVASQLSNDIANVNFQGQTTANNNYQDLLNRHNRLTHVNSITSKSIESLQMATATIDDRIAGDLEPLIWKPLIPTANQSQEFKITQNSTIADNKSTSITTYDWIINFNSAKIGTRVKLRINNSSVNIRRNIKLIMIDGLAAITLLTLTANGTFNGVEITLTEERTVDDLILTYMKDGRVIDLTSTTAITNPITGLIAMDGRLADTTTLAEHANTNFNNLGTWVRQPNKPTYTADEVGAATIAEVDNINTELLPLTTVSIVLPQSGGNIKVSRNTIAICYSPISTITYNIEQMPLGVWIRIRNNGRASYNINYGTYSVALNYKGKFDEIKILSTGNNFEYSITNYLSNRIIDVQAMNLAVSASSLATTANNTANTANQLATTAKNVADGVNTAITNPTTGLTSVNQRLTRELTPLVWSNREATPNSTITYTVTGNISVVDRASTGTTRQIWTFNCDNAPNGTQIKTEICIDTTANISRNIDIRINGQTKRPATISTTGDYSGVIVTIRDRANFEYEITYLKGGKVVDYTSVNRINEMSTELAAVRSTANSSQSLANKAQFDAIGVSEASNAFIQAQKITMAVVEIVTNVNRYISSKYWYNIRATGVNIYTSNMGNNTYSYIRRVPTACYVTPTVEYTNLTIDGKTVQLRTPIVNSTYGDGQVSDIVIYKNYKGVVSAYGYLTVSPDGANCAENETNKIKLF